MMKKIPYFIRTFWSEEDQCYIAEVPELKGCSGLGATPEKALKEAQTSIENWIHVAKKEGIPLPTPVVVKHAGRLNLRLPGDVVAKIRRDAKEHNMSLNQYVLWRLAS